MGAGAVEVDSFGGIAVGESICGCGSEGSGVIAVVNKCCGAVSGNAGGGACDIGGGGVGVAMGGGVEGGVCGREDWVRVCRGAARRAMARARIMLSCAGYAAARLLFQVPSLFQNPPARCSCDSCVHLRSSRSESMKPSAGVHMRVVSLRHGVPNAHCWKVIMLHSVSALSAMISLTTHKGEWSASTNSFGQTVSP